MNFFIKIFSIAIFFIIGNKCNDINILNSNLRSEFNFDKQFFKLLILSNQKDTNILENQFSKYFKLLRDQGHELIFKYYSSNSVSKDIELQNFNEYIYDNIIILDNYDKKKSLKPNFPVSLVHPILDYIDYGNNVVVFTDTIVDDEQIYPTNGIKKLATECNGIEFNPHNTFLKDITKKNGLIETKHCLEGDAVFDPTTCKNNLLYNGIGFSLKSIVSNNDTLLLPLVKVSNTTILFSKEFGENIYDESSDLLGLIVAMQGRNNVRVTFSTDSTICSDEIFILKPNNFNYCKDIMLWTFQQKGLIKMTRLIHWRYNTTSKYSYYKTNKNHTEYIEEDYIKFSFNTYYTQNNEWKPFITNDMKFEFVMLEPYIRDYLDSNKNGSFSKLFQIPDQKGVFKFIIDYNKIGYNYIHHEELVTVRTIKHDQVDRFFHAAFPHYVAFIISILSFFVLIIIFTYSSPKSKIE